MKNTCVVLLAFVGMVWSCSDLCKLHLHSPSNEIYYNYFPFVNNRVEFEIRSAGPVRILLSNDYAPNVNANYEVIIGYNNTQNVRIFRDGNLAGEKDGPIFDPNTFRHFVIIQSNGEFKLLTNANGEVLSLVDYYYVPMKIVGVAVDRSHSAELIYNCKQFVNSC